MAFVIGGTVSVTAFYYYYYRAHFSIVLPGLQPLLRYAIIKLDYI